MNSLIFLINSLSKKEESILMALYDVEGEKKQSKKLELYNTIKLSGYVSDREISLKLYNELPSSKFSQLKSRLTRDILSIMTIEEGKSNYSSEYFANKHEVKQLLIDSELLYVRGAASLANKYLEKAYKKSIKYELSHELLNVLDLLQKHVGQVKGPLIFSKYSEEKFRALSDLKSKYDGFQTYYKIMLPSLFSGSTNIDSASIEDAILELERLYGDTNSREIYSLLLRAKTFYYNQIKDFEKALLAAEMFLKLTESDPIVKSASNEAGANMQISLLYIYMNKFDQSLIYINKSLNLFNKNSGNELRALNVKFVVNTVLDDLREMEKVLQIINSNKTLEKDKYLRDLWLLRKATFLFKSGQYNDSLLYIQKCNDLVSDKSGWRIGLKILELLCIIELGHFDWFELRLDSLYRLLLHTKGSKNSRAWRIYSVFKELQRVNFNWKTKAILESRDFQALNGDRDEFTWDPFGFEVLPMHKWLKGKIIL